jgi:hypothetical protein
MVTQVAAGLTYEKPVSAEAGNVVEQTATVASPMINGVRMPTGFR